MEKIKMRVIAREIQNGNSSFMAFKTVDKKGNKYDLKFKKDCKNIPTESCFIVVDSANVNYDARKLYPVYWISNQVEEIIPFEKEEKTFEELFEVVA